MNDDQQRERRNNRIMGSDYDAWKLSNREDEEERYCTRQRREEMLEKKSEWEAECKKDDELTMLDCDEIIIDSGICTVKPPMVSDADWDEELQDRSHLQYEIEKEMRRQQDIEMARISARGY